MPNTIPKSVCRSATTGISFCKTNGTTKILQVNDTGWAFSNLAPAPTVAVADCVPAADGTSAGTQLNLLLAQLRLHGVI